MTPEELEELFPLDSLNHYIRSTAARMSGSHQRSYDLDDLAQEAHLRVLKILPRCENQRGIKTFLRRHIKGAMLDCIGRELGRTDKPRKISRVLMTKEELNELAIPAVCVPCGSEVIVEAHLLLDSLSPVDRSVLEARFIRDRTYKQMGQEIGITESGARLKVLSSLERVKRFVQMKASRVRTLSSGV